MVNEAPDCYVGTTMKQIRVLLVDDNLEFMDSAAAFLSLSPRMQIVGRANNGLEGVRLAGELRADLILMDLAMPELGGLAATLRIKGRQTSPRVIIVTLHDQPEYRRTAELVGADAFVSKSDFADEIHALIGSLFSESESELNRSEIP